MTQRCEEQLGFSLCEARWFVMEVIRGYFDSQDGQLRKPSCCANDRCARTIVRAFNQFAEHDREELTDKGSVSPTRESPRPKGIAQTIRNPMPRSTARSSGSTAHCALRMAPR
jgi:hypothetical protein